MPDGTHESLAADRLVVGWAERHAETGSFWESADPNEKTSNIFVDIACS